ncbi:sugar lactone lactonase YvrE [Actinoplanes octamycinicus]|uniref:Sugar lactone lactonase YvrE n=1 Tax=Actinoplanes octamycinicus TaxID=135948 RepID=A0A7W7GU17_9ACTN|nr:Ig-like domain repeat protein [Actinoplanes octamycinicus]MBB4738291.1 sugar lactone lactonase YvrE [Actinoplanes octamycinicus]
MRARSIRRTAYVAVTALVTGVVFSYGTFAASADTTVITAPQNAYLFQADMAALGDLVVDTKHQRLIASDPKRGLLAIAPYTGGIGQKVTDLDSVAGLAMSTDSGTLYAAVPAAHAIVAFSTDTYTETGRYSLSDNVYPRDVVVAGDRLWFTYDNNGSAGNFGSIDPATKAVTTHAYARIAPYYRAPLIAANPGAPGLIALSDNSGTSGNQVMLYDVSSGTDIQTAGTGVAGLSFIRDLALSHDGSEVIVAGGGGTFRLRAADLSVVDQPWDTVGDAVDAAPDGRLAMAGRTDPGVADLYTYDAGSTSPARAIDMPIPYHLHYTNPDQIMENGIVWQPDGRRLFVVTDNAGLMRFRALNEPVATTITLAAPATATRGKPLTVTGTIDGALPAGTRLTVRRDDPEGTDRQLAEVSTDDSGAFALTDVPTAGGNVTYRVTYAGDDTHLPTTAASTIAISRDVPALSISGHNTVHPYNSAVTVTAHLGATYRNRSVELSADPAGTDQPNRVVKRAVVDTNGNLSVSLRLTRTTVLTAAFAGDSRYAPRTVKATLYAKVNLSTAVTKQYKTSRGYHYFRKTKNPVFTTTMTPSAGRKQRLTIEYYSAGKWRPWKTATLKLTSTGKSTYTLTGTHKTGIKYRVRSGYINGTSGDSLNYTSYGPYRYFTFTK